VKLLIIDQDDVGLNLAWRSAQAGHQVRLFTDPKHAKHRTAEGWTGVTRVENFLSYAGWADVIFPTSNQKYIEKLDALRRDGAHVFGPTVRSAALEIKRSDGMRFLEDHGIDVPPYKQFNSLADAESYVWKRPERYVFKTLGDNEDKSLSYCSRNAADMIARLERWQAIGMNPKGPVMLQEFIEGIELGVSCWLGVEGRIGPWNENFEHKRLMSAKHGSGCGPNTGEMGTVMQYVRESKLAEAVLEPLIDSLVRMGHSGDVDVNCIIDEKGKAWPLELTTRAGWPAFNIQIASHKGDPVKWMEDAITGGIDTLQVSHDVAVGVVIAQPDFPYDQKKPDEVGGIPIYGVDRGNARYLAPQGVRMQSMPVMDGQAVTRQTIWTTSSTYVAVATGLGTTVQQARDRAYKVVESIHLANAIYRDDIGEELERTLPILHEHGYTSEMNYG
jgi:phosphoribosylamine--glycine ligase